MFFEWNDKIQLGISEIDAEHKQIIVLMNELHALNENRASSNRLLAKFDELIQCARDHFADEEEYMKKIAYAKLQVHANIHRQLLQSLENYREQFSLAAAATYPKELFLLLKGWLTTHILGIDRQYAAHARSASAGA